MFFGRHAYADITATHRRQNLMPINSNDYSEDIGRRMPQWVYIDSLVIIVVRESQSHHLIRHLRHMHLPSIAYCVLSHFYALFWWSISLKWIEGWHACSFISPQFRKLEKMTASKTWHIECKWSFTANPMLVTQSYDQGTSTISFLFEFLMALLSLFAISI